MTTPPSTLMKERLVDTVNRFVFNHDEEAVITESKNGPHLFISSNDNEPIWNGLVNDTESLNKLTDILTVKFEQKHSLSGSYIKSLNWLDQSDDLDFSASTSPVSEAEMTELAKELQVLASCTFEEMGFPQPLAEQFIEARAVVMGPVFKLDDEPQARRPKNIAEIGRFGQEVSFQITISNELPITSEMLKEVEQQLLFSTDMYPDLVDNSINLSINKSEHSLPMRGRSDEVKASIEAILTEYSVLEPHQKAMLISTAINENVGYTSPTLLASLNEVLSKRGADKNNVFATAENHLALHMLKGMAHATSTPAPVDLKVTTEPEITKPKQV